MDTGNKSASSSGITVRFSDTVRERVKSVARLEHRSAAGYIERLVEQDLLKRDEEERLVRVYVSADAPKWCGEVVRGEGETEEQHRDRTNILNQLFGAN